MPMFEDSGVSLPSDANDELARLDEQIANFDGSNIDALNRLCAQRINLMSNSQLDEAAAEQAKVRTMQDIADETFSRLMKLGTDASNSAEVRVEALKGAWQVSADFARFCDGK